jgi:hypothetical protein
MNAATLWTRLSLVAVLLAGCGGSTTSGKSHFDGGIATGGSGGGSRFDAGVPSGDAAPAQDASGGGAGGSGGGGGAGGSGGGFYPDAGSSADGGFPSPGDASADAFGGPPPPPPPPPKDCTITISGVDPQDLTQVPVGPTAKVRVEGTVDGPRVPATPLWRWTVIREETRTTLTPAVVEMNPAVREFPVTVAGRYTITAEVAATANGPTVCNATVVATGVDDPTVQFWLRITPPTSDLPVMEGTIVTVSKGQSISRDLSIDRGLQLAINPQDETGRDAINAYVRITSPNSSVRLEGHTQGGPYSVNLDAHLMYDVLVIPDGLIAPKLFQGSPAVLNQTFFRMEEGVPVSGHLTGPNGPIKDGRILLQGLVPSTVGRTLADGKYQLRVQGQLPDFTAVFIPPADSGLPQARVVAGRGVRIYPTTQSSSIDFAWAALPSTGLDLSVRRSDNTPAGKVRVRLASVAGSLPPAGTLTIQRGFDLPAEAFVEIERDTDAGGLVSFNGLPAGKYTATLSPLDGAAAITTVTLDLSTPGGPAMQTVKLARKVSLTGKLLPATLTTGATVLALDADSDPGNAPPSAQVDGEGRYTLALDPGRHYALVLEPLPARLLPRRFLRSIVAPDKDSTRDDLTVPQGLTIAGIVDSGGTPIKGALVEAYCIGLPPACIEDTNSPSTSNVRPTAESVTDESGAYRLLVPDPGIAN